MKLSAWDVNALSQPKYLGAEEALSRFEKSNSD